MWNMVGILVIQQPYQKVYHIDIPLPPHWVVSRFKAMSTSSSLSRGTYADEMFMYESSQAEFEIMFCNLEWSDLFDMALS